MNCPDTGNQRYRLVRLLPILLIACAVVVDLITPRVQRYDALLYVVPTLAAVSWGVWPTLGFGVAAAVALVLCEAAWGDVLSRGVSGAVLVMIISGVAAWCSAVRQRREQQLRQATVVADVAQRALQHPLPEHLGAVDLYLLYETSVAGAHLGGDFYKALRVPGGVRMMIGDVQGKGLGAVESAAVLLGSFRESAYGEDDLPGVARKLEASMRHHAARAGIVDADRFATVLLAEIPDDQPLMRLLSCGHPPPVRQGADGQAVYLTFRDPSPPVHLPVELDHDHVVEEVAFQAGDRILMYTDGVSETRDRLGEFYPLAERLTAWSSAPDRDITARLVADLTAYSDHGLDDDTAAVLVVRRPRT